MIRFATGKQSGASMSPAELDAFRRLGLPGARKVASKDCSAVAYLVDHGPGRFSVKLFVGKRAKPEGYYRFGTAAGREKYVRDFFARIGRNEAFRKDSAAGKRQPHKWEVGAVFRTCWGYDQTNVEFFEVVRIVGPYSVELREVAGVDVGGGHGGDSSRTVPAYQKYIGAPIVRRAYGKDAIRIDEVRRAWPWDGKPAAYSWGH